MEMMESNKVTLCGEVVGEFIYSHEVFGERFYKITLLISRLSGVYDRIPVMVSERLLDVNDSLNGKRVEVDGQFRSFNLHEGERNKLVLSVFARDIKPDAESDGEYIHDQNKILLDGYICKKPNYRKTPLGREIADILLTVNRPYGKSDYIPCICWGRNARFVDNFDAGTRINVFGRIQSREYSKNLPDGETENRVAYEVSVNRIEEVADDGQKKD